MAVAIIPYDNKDPMKYLFSTVHQIHKMGIDVVIVDRTFSIYPPYVKRIKQKTPGIGGARYDGFTYALRERYDCIINADSHLIFSGNIEKLCKTNTFSSTYHYPWIAKPSITLPIRIYASVIYTDGEKIYWCTLLEKPPYLPMTSEPLYAVRSNVLELIVEKWKEYTTYGLDNTAFLWGPEGEIIDEIHFYHLGVTDRNKPLKRKPSDEEATKFIQQFHRFSQKVTPLLSLNKKACYQLWP